MAVLTRAYRNGEPLTEAFPLADLSAQLADPDTIVWIDVSPAGEEELDGLAAEFALHELHVEDALEAHQRPKIDDDDSYLFLACHAVWMDADGGDMTETEIDAFVGERWIVTVRKDDRFSLDPVVARCARSSQLARHGTGYILHALLDEVVDGYFDVIEVFDQFVEDLSDRLFEDDPRPLDPAEQHRLFDIRRALGRFHRRVAPMREVMSSLLRSEHPALGGEISRYFQDVYDHVLWVNDSTDAAREISAGIADANLSLRDYRQNQIVKTVSGWAAIIAVPAMITGYYGMNVRFPGVATRWGAALASAVIVFSGIILYRQFRRRDWL